MKLAIISHTEHYQADDGSIVGWGPTVSEINHLAEDFEEIYHVAFLHTGSPPPSSLPYTKGNVHFVALRPVGGKGMGDKLGIVANMPKILNTVRKTLKQVDVFQVRTPTGMGVFLIPYLSLFSRKKGWYKYAGNWNQKNPPLGYALQRWMLKRQRRKVTINGSWPKQPKHCLTFENPCLAEEERKEGLGITRGKKFEPPFRFCFVGRLEDAKGVQRIIDAFGSLESLDKVASIHFIGDGEKMDFYKDKCEQLKLPVVFHGFFERKKVFEIYKKSHFIILPSDSEGFPKVVAEGMNYGAVPIVSDISSIGQYVNANNGYLLKPITALAIKGILEEVYEESSENLQNKAIDSHNVAAKFTFTHYRKKIQNQIIKNHS